MNMMILKKKGKIDVWKLFDLSIDEDYYKPVIINDAFNRNYIKYESKGNKDKILSFKEYLDMMRPYLSDVINKHKTQGEWKIQLIMAINFIISIGSNETRTMHTKSGNIEITMGGETDETIEDFLNLFCKDINKD